MRVVLATTLLAVAWFIVGCAGQAQPGGGPSAPPSAATGAPQPQPDRPELVGRVSVNALPYGLPNATGYDTAVSFTVRNPSDFPMVSPYRIVVSGRGKTLQTTSGSETVVLAPHQDLLVVDKPSNITNTPPDAATVTFYANQAGQMSLPDPSGWKLTNVSGPNCNFGHVGCDVTADLTYDGRTDADMRFSINGVAIAFTRGENTVFAGRLSLGNIEERIVPGQPLPVSGYVVGAATDVTGLRDSYGVAVIQPTYR
jgi:hypothetical protein